MIICTSENIIPSNNVNLTFSTDQELAVLMSPFTTPTCQSHNTTVTNLRDTSKSQFHLPGAIHLASHVVMTTHVIITYSRSSSCTRFTSISPWYSRGPKGTSYFITVIWNYIILPGCLVLFNYIFHLFLAVAVFTNKDCVARNLKIVIAWLKTGIRHSVFGRA